MKRSPGSIIEIDVKVVDGQVYFHRFFVHWVLALKALKKDVGHTLV